MRSLLIAGFLLALMISGCGGGGDSGTTPDPGSDNGSEDGGDGGSAGNGDDTGGAALTGKVIDGYIHGATVFIDLNWSLTLDEGEPQATSDENGDFAFSEEDLAGFSCHTQRPIVADVPQGAEDLDRGLVNSPFRLIYIPSSAGALGPDSPSLNITPFTTLFAAVLDDAVAAADGFGLPVEEACGDTGNAIAVEVFERIAIIETQLLDDNGLSLATFYEDFIENGDAQMAKSAEALSDYLKTVYTLSEDVRARFESRYATPAFVSVFPDDEAIAGILNGATSAPYPLTLSVTVEGATSGDDGWTAVDTIRADGVYVTSDGQLAETGCAEGPTGACNHHPATLDGLLAAAKNYNDVADWRKTQDASGYEVHLANSFWKSWKEDLGEHRCHQADRFMVENPSAMQCKGGECDTDAIDEVRLLEAEYYGGQHQAPPIACEYEDAPLVYIFRSSIFPKTTEGYWQAGIQYSFALETLETSRIDYLATTSLYEEKDTFDEEAAIDELVSLPWSPAQLDELHAGLQADDWFALSVESDTHKNTYVSLGSCEVYEKTVSGDVLVQSASDDDAAARTLCFGDSTQWPAP